MKKYILLLALLSALPCMAKHTYLEKDYQNYWCSSQKGITEYKLPDQARVDCLTEKYAVEFDFANKWAECVGQALYYGHQTNRIPACVLIIEDDIKDIKYMKRLENSVKGINFMIWQISPKEIKAK